MFLLVLSQISSDLLFQLDGLSHTVQFVVYEVVHVLEVQVFLRRVLCVEFFLV